MFKRLFTENLFWKAISLVFAVVLWWYVSTEQTNKEVAKEVAVELQNIPGELVRTSDFINKIDIRVQGPRGAIEKVKSEDLRYMIDLSKAQAAPRTIKFYSSRISGLPANVQVTEISPSQMTIILEEKAVKDLVPVSIEITGKPAYGYEVVEDSKSVKPAFVKVSGAKSIVDRTTNVPTEVIDITGSKETISKVVGLDLLGSHVELPDTSEVVVRIEVRQQIVEMKFEEIPVRAVNTTLVAEIQPPSLVFTVTGPKLLLDTLKEGDLSAYVDADGLAPGEHLLQTKITTPAGVEIADSQLVQVKVLLSEPLPTVIEGEKKPIGGG